MNNNLVKRISQITGYVVLGISVLLAVVYYFGIGDEIKVSANVDLMMNWTIILIIVIIALAFLIGPIISVITSPKTLVKGGISIGILLVIFALAYAFSGGDVSTVYLNYEIEGLKQKLAFTELGLISFYIIGALTVFAIFVSEIKSLLKL
jgi:hypothetical protein